MVARTIKPKAATKLIKPAKSTAGKDVSKKVVNDPSEKTVNVSFVQSKETKGAVVYSEVDAKGNALELADAVIGQLYVRKAKLPGGSAPRTLRVTLDF